MSDLPDDPKEFDRCWSNQGGSVASMGEAILECEKRAQVAFIQRRDDVANALRDLARELKYRQDKMAEKLTEYIKESKRREYEIRKAVGH